jgi:hypothetical protein
VFLRRFSKGVDMYFEKSDPTCNSQFSKRWTNRSSFFHKDSPAALDRRADKELAEGRHQVAERLSRRAAELRGMAA